jgi:hypothetical protein
MPELRNRSPYIGRRRIARPFTLVTVTNKGERIVAQHHTAKAARRD